MIEHNRRLHWISTSLEIHHRSNHDRSNQVVCIMQLFHQALSPPASSIALRKWIASKATKVSITSGKLMDLFASVPVNHF